jgi:hypothetical protein
VSSWAEINSFVGQARGVGGDAPRAAAWARIKHQKANASSVDVFAPVQLLANVSQRVFSNNLFGFFERVQKVKFGARYKGLFRAAHGRPPFLRFANYEGSVPFSEDQAFIVNPAGGTAFPLQPLLFWDVCVAHPDVDPAGHCYLYDKSTAGKRTYSFKAAAYPCFTEIGEESQYGELAQRLYEFREADPKVEILDGISLLELDPE